jgi:hypothetical protein
MVDFITVLVMVDFKVEFTMVDFITVLIMVDFKVVFTMVDFITLLIMVDFKVVFIMVQSYDLKSGLNMQVVDCTSLLLNKRQTNASKSLPSALEQMANKCQQVASPCS